MLSSAADGVHSKNLGYRSNVPGGPIGHSYGANSGSFLADSTRPSMLHDGSHIDLALVYANFLNPKPDCKSVGTINNGLEIPELGSDHFDPSLEFSTTPDHMTGGSSIQLPRIPELSTKNCCDRHEQIYFYGLDSFHRHQDRSDYQHCASEFVLPPLPDQELIWSSTSDHMMVSQTIQATHELPVIGGSDHQTHQDENLLAANWSPFDLPSDDTFSGGVQEKI